LPAAQGAPSSPSTTVDPRFAAIESTTPYLTPNGEFYRIDTALSFPQIDLASWKLRVTGMVDHELEFTYRDLLSMPQVTHTVTLCCVSNEVGGDLISNALWQGVRLSEVLAQAGVREGAQQIFSTSVDGWTSGFPVAAALDGRDAMIALGMNGAPLPLEHGFPARLVVPGLYGYVSATKWLSSIELTTWAANVGYWVPFGWSREAPVKTESRIDVPKRGDTVRAGLVGLAGVAWAQHRGIARVEVSIDNGPWQQATLGSADIDDAWRQWVFAWQASAGSHTVRVRATDKTGAIQTDQISSPDPDGATGYHTRRFNVV
jgi:DMSO/TMAO reductase YedYZ molybdopterin-dependent catalytic subunit